jgi:hypothetical protein
MNVPAVISTIRPKAIRIMALNPAPPLRIFPKIGSVPSAAPRKSISGNVDGVEKSASVSHSGAFRGQQNGTIFGPRRGCFPRQWRPERLVNSKIDVNENRFWLLAKKYKMN